MTSKIYEKPCGYECWLFGHEHCKKHQQSHRYLIKREGKKRFRKAMPPFILNPKDELKVIAYNPADKEQQVTLGISGFIVSKKPKRR